MNYTYLNVFYVVAVNQNISVASKELNVSQPAVSRIISNLEKEYNTKLFVRSKNGVSLTKEGLNLFNKIKGPYSQLEKLEKDLSNNKAFINSTIYIGTTATALYVLLFKCLDKIKTNFPNIQFNLYTGSSTQLLSKLNEGKIDFALVTTPFNYGDDIEITNIFNLNDVLIAPISYKEKISGMVSIKDIKKYPIIMLNEEMQYREHINKYLMNNGVKINPSFEVDSSSILVNLVNNNYGLSFIPYSMAESAIKEGKCFKVDLIEEIPERHIAFAIKKDGNHSIAVYKIKELLEQQE